jgi:hypothetical protein
VPTRWADYPPGPARSTWVLLALGDLILVGLGLAQAFGLAGLSPDPLLGGLEAIAGPALLTALVHWANSTSLVRLGVSETGLVLVFPRRTVEVLWSELLPPKLGEGRSGYYFAFYWKKGTGSSHSFIVDPVSAKYMVDHPCCPRWELAATITKELADRPSSPRTNVRVHVDP